jgi:hypothetical protein
MIFHYTNVRRHHRERVESERLAVADTVLTLSITKRTMAQQN